MAETALMDHLCNYVEFRSDTILMPCNRENVLEKFNLDSEKDSCQSEHNYRPFYEIKS